MGQRLHFYATKDHTLPQLEAWVDCRAKEYTETPKMGFEADSYAAVQEMMIGLCRHPACEHQHQCGSTWSVQAYPDIGWTVWECTPDKIEAIRQSGRNQMATHAGLKRAHPDADWTTGILFDWLEKHIGWNILVDHEGI